MRILLLLLTACGEPFTVDTDALQSATIGVEGGELSLGDGSVTLEVPPGALTEPVTLTIAPIASLPDVDELAAVELGPSGTQFLAPVRVVFRDQPDAAWGALFGDPAQSDGPSTLTELSIAGDDVTVTTTHFSAAAIGRDGPPDTHPPPGVESARDAAARVDPTDDAAYVDALRAWHALIEADLTDAGNSLEDLELAAREFLEWQAAVQARSFDGSDGLVPLIDADRATLLAGLAREEARIHADAISEDDPQQLNRLLTDVLRLANTLAFGEIDGFSVTLLTGRSPLNVHLDQVTLRGAPEPGHLLLSGRLTYSLGATVGRVSPASMSVDVSAVRATPELRTLTPGVDGTFSLDFAATSETITVTLDGRFDVLRDFAVHTERVLSADVEGEHIVAVLGQRTSDDADRTGPISVDASESVVVTARVTHAGVPVVDQALTFELVGPGSLTETDRRTDTTGAAFTVFTPGAERGSSFVIARFAQGDLVSEDAIELVRSPLRVVIGPDDPKADVGEELALGAVVDGTDNDAVAWGTSGGAVITDAGIFHADLPGSYVVAAVSLEDPSAFAVATVEVAGDLLGTVTYRKEEQGNFQNFDDGQGRYDQLLVSRENIDATIVLNAHLDDAGLPVFDGATCTYTYRLHVEDTQTLASVDRVSDEVRTGTSCADAFFSISASPVLYVTLPYHWTRTVVDHGSEPFTQEGEGSESLSLNYSQNGGLLDFTYFEFVDLTRAGPFPAPLGTGFREEQVTGQVQL
jgi:hypothetical protein